jgi:hypothetical protein
VRTPRASKGPALPANITDKPDADAVVFFAHADGPRASAGRRMILATRAIFGPREVNFNWYSTWDSGRDRVVVMTSKKAKAASVDLAH